MMRRCWTGSNMQATAKLVAADVMFPGCSAACPAYLGSRQSGTTGKTTSCVQAHSHGSDAHSLPHWPALDLVVISSSSKLDACAV